MEKVNINPLDTLSFKEVVQFKEAIDSNFQLLEIEGEIIVDLKTRWWDLHQECLKYAFDNHREITEGYPEMRDRNFGDVVIVLQLGDVAD